MRILLHEFDSTGISQDNLILEELHILSEATALTIVSRYGLFYSNSVVVTNALTNIPLRLNIDYIFEGFDPEITALTNIECHSAIIFLTNTFTNVLVTYQCVGGAEGENSYLVQELRDKITNITTNVVPYSKVLNKPQRFPAIAHLHEVLTDLTGLESINNNLGKIVDALINVRGPINSALKINDRVDRLLAIITKLRLDINKLALNANRRATTIVYGVDRLATQVEVIDGVLNHTIVTPETLHGKINEHLTQVDPHSQYVMDVDLPTIIDAAFVVHNTDANPHNQYLLKTDVVKVTNPGSILSLNKQVIDKDFTVPDGYDAEAVGDLIVNRGVNLKVPRSKLFVGKSMDGFTALPSPMGGRIIQGGLQQIPQYQWRIYVNFPIAFNSVESITGSHVGGGGAMFVVESGSVSNWGFIAIVTTVMFEAAGGNGGWMFYWHAEGY